MPAIAILRGLSFLRACRCLRSVGRLRSLLAAAEVVEVSECENENVCDFLRSFAIAVAAAYVVEVERAISSRLAPTPALMEW